MIVAAQPLLSKFSAQRAHSTSKESSQAPTEARIFHVLLDNPLQNPALDALHGYHPHGPTDLR